MNEELNITRKQFMAYEEIRQSGITNMFDTRTVAENSDGYLDRKAVTTILRDFGTNYSKLVEKYADVKDEVVRVGENWNMTQTRKLLKRGEPFTTIINDAKMTAGRMSIKTEERKSI